MSEIMKIIDETKTKKKQQQKTNKQTNKKQTNKAKTEKERGMEAIVKEWELNNFIVRLS